MNTMDKWTVDGGMTRGAAERAIERDRTAHLANNLSSVAVQQWEKTLTGILAFPAAVALGTAASVMYGVALVERGFGVFESAVTEVGRSLARGGAQGVEMREGRERPEARA
jgi:hypothetical protein